MREGGGRQSVETEEGVAGRVWRRREVAGRVWRVSGELRVDAQGEGAG